ncbi:hypothetical protein ZTR_09614 [Talaromyces verruculosus]|nr:hypothetical protein ZTR_09614 [Talaromyces verruculosus]
MEKFDLLIVGAGFHGLIMAKTFLQVNPDAKLLVVDQAQSLGGSWAKERLYPGLKTNNIFGTYEFSDFPMIPERYGAEPVGHIPGPIVHEYLCDMARHYSINSCLRFKTKVDSAKLEDNGTWTIKLRPVDQPSSPFTTVAATKLVIASGRTSEPNVPKFAGQESFGGRILHSKQLKSQMGSLSSDDNVVVLGGNKSSWDACYGAARSGCRVHMVMRPSGGGPSYLWPRNFSWGPLQLSLGKLSATRMYTLFDPTLFGNDGPFHSLRYFLHRTSIGQKICQWFWNSLDAHIRKIQGYSNHPGIRNLEPWTTPFWMGNSLSIHNYDTNWFDLVVEGRITVHIAEVDSLSEGKVHLSNGENLCADALVCCTGWKIDPPVRFEPPHISSCITLPEKSEEIDLDIKMASEDLRRQRNFLSTLRHRTSNAPEVPPHSTRAHPSCSYQLHRMVVPCNREFLDNKALAFIGLHSSVHAAIVAQAQALWITAFFGDKIGNMKTPNTNFEHLRYSTVLQSVYERTRRPKDTGGAAGRYPDLVFDSVPYVDTLLRDLGVEPKRKKSWLKEFTQAYTPLDYKGLVDEWSQKMMNHSA